MERSRQGWNAGNLPPEATSFIGRAAELSALADLVAEARLVTLTGAGGVGKTRLARRAGDQLRGTFPDGVWLVELSSLRQSGSIVLAVYEALRLADQSSRTAIEVVIEWLADKRLLLILDCCEHLADRCGGIVEVLLAAVPGVHVLATSRCPLKAQGERVVAVPSLPVTTAGRSPEAALADAAVLFVERASQAAHRAITVAQDGAAVAEICTRLEGIPLAIELAAARLPEMSLDQLRERLHTRLETLTARDGRAPQGELRHQMLRTTIGWSHELCTPRERLAWARFSVFAGGFEHEAAEWVCVGGPLGSGQMAGLLSSLTDKSVLQRTETPHGPRYSMLDAVREFGQEWLTALGEEQRLSERHRDYYRWLARLGSRQWLGPEQTTWYQRSAAEHANLRVALERCVADPDPRPALEMAGDLWFFWFFCGFQREGRHYLERALAKQPATGPGPERFWARWAHGSVALAQGDHTAAQTSADACTSMVHTLDDPAAAAAVRYLTGSRLALVGQSAQAIALLGETDDLPNHGHSLTIRLVTLAALGFAHLRLGQFARATAIADTMRKESEDQGEQWMSGFAHYLLSAAAQGAGDPAAAVRHAREALTIKRRWHEPLGNAMILDTLASVVTNPVQAARLLGITDALWHSIGQPRMGNPALLAARRAREHALRDALGDAAYEAAHRTGLETGIDDGMTYALNAE